MGHDRGTPKSPFWSTAQGRFGPALTIEGVQHPAPQLRCGVTRDQGTLVASAPYAQPFYDGANALPSPPNTEIWVAVYVQVQQTDKASMRNIQLDLRRCTSGRLTEQQGVTRERIAYASWSERALQQMLKR